MKNFLKALTLLLLTLISTSGFSQDNVTDTKESQSNFIHMVFFWLKDTSDKETSAFKNRTIAFLDQVNSIDSYHVGIPAATDGAIIERSYTVALVVTFEDKKAYDIYQEHEAHKSFIDDCNHLWDSVKVFDTYK